MIILLALFLFVLSLVFAFVEIEIEGKFGWAEKLPTWYRKSKIADLFNGQRPLSGYFVFMILFLLVMFHMGFFLGLIWSIAAELQIISYFLIFIAVEDFLWFVFNPNYGIKNFKKDKIWWHYNCKWIFGLFPADYVVVIIITLLLNYFSSLLIGNITIFYNYVYSLLIILVLVFLASVLLPKVYKKWYFELRKKDERKKFNIFH